jgi:citrate lyase beta subunit
MFASCIPSAALLASTFPMQSEDPAKKEWLTQTVYQKLKSRLDGRCIQDFRIDFEDGFGPRAPAEEDLYARQAAEALVQALDQGAVPPRIGIRIKSLGYHTRSRALRTLTVFLGRFISLSPHPLPSPFIVTLPKVEDKSQAAELDRVLSAMEGEFGLPSGAIKVELMVESPLALMHHTGICPLPSFAEACQHRLLGVHLGAYDLTASIGIPGAFQDLAHPVCVFARTIMKSAFASHSVELADGASHLIPVGEPPQVCATWSHIYHQVQRSVSEGYYHGWDIHPAQIPPRYAALYGFFLSHLEGATARLRNLLNSTTKAGRVGAAFDDAASGTGLLNFFRQGFSCGAFTTEDLATAGLTTSDLRLTSLSQILQRESPTNEVP